MPSVCVNAFPRIQERERQWSLQHVHIVSLGWDSVFGRLRHVMRPSINDLNVELLDAALCIVRSSLGICGSGRPRALQAHGLCVRRARCADKTDPTQAALPLVRGLQERKRGVATVMYIQVQGKITTQVGAVRTSLPYIWDSGTLSAQVSKEADSSQCLPSKMLAQFRPPPCPTQRMCVDFCGSAPPFQTTAALVMSCQDSG